MKTDLADLFAVHESSLVDWHGPLYSLYELPYSVTSLNVKLRPGKDSIVQGLRLSARGGNLMANGHRAPDLELWADTAPPTVAIGVDWGRSGARSLRVWNVWRVNGVTQAWMGNAGMRVTAADDGVVLRCSDGVGAVDFSDLSVDIAFGLDNAEGPLRSRDR